jgi:serine/threonine protein phosphatase PrpC
MEHWTAFLQHIGISAQPAQLTSFLEQYHSFLEDSIWEKWDEYKETFETNNMANKFGQENDPEDKEKLKNETLNLQIKNKNITFPNGKVNQPYSVEFDVEKLGIPDIDEVSFSGLEIIGLQYYPEEKRIKGIPALPGDHKISLKCKRKDWEEGKPVFERTLTLIINPDPRLLWKNTPTPDTILYYKPDEDKAFVRAATKKTSVFLGIGKKVTPRKDLVAASQRGRSHAHEGKPRDDDFALSFNEDSEWYILVVADGAGSAKYSRKGAEIACQTVREVCEKQLAACKDDFEKQIRQFENDKSPEKRKPTADILYTILGTAVFQAYKRIEKEAAEQENPLKDYATTLLLAICKKFETGWFIGAFWVGDGGMGVYNRETSFVKILGEPDGGEFAGQTRFLTMPEIVKNELYKRLRFDIYPDFTALILMTDGVTDPKFETDANLGRIEKWHALWDDLSKEVTFADDNAQTADQLLKWLDFWSPGNHDDRTIAILF